MFCPVPQCTRGRPYRIPGYLARHLNQCHGDIYNNNGLSKAGADLAFAKEVTRRQMLVALPDIEDGQIISWEEEEEELSGQIWHQPSSPSSSSAFPSLVDLFNLGPFPQQQPPLSSLPSSLPSSPPPPPPPAPAPPPPQQQQQQQQQHRIAASGISVTILLYDLETTG